MNIEMFVPLARASSEATTEVSHGGKEVEAKEGLSLQPSVIGIQILNFIVLLVCLKMILYKPLLKVLKDREERIREGVENAEKADILLKESNTSRVEILKKARGDSQEMLEAAKKSSEKEREAILAEAAQQAHKIMVAGEEKLELERSKVAEELKTRAVDMVLLTAEKVLKEKLSPEKDKQLVEDALKNYAL